MEVSVGCCDPACPIFNSLPAPKDPTLHPQFTTVELPSTCLCFLPTSPLPKSAVSITAKMSKAEGEVNQAKKSFM